jgi:hypothetical protein
VSHQDARWTSIPGEIFRHVTENGFDEPQSKARSTRQLEGFLSDAGETPFHFQIALEPNAVVLFAYYLRDSTTEK